MKTQALGWLAAGVLAAGLNASYHEGGLQWAHRIADQVCQSTAAVVALASGHADEFLTEVRTITAHDQTASCRLSRAMGRVQARIERSELPLDGFEVMSARQEAALARLEANRARIEARVAAKAGRFRIATTNFDPAVFESIQIPEIRVQEMRVPSVCPRIRVNIPHMPNMKMPVAPVIHIETAGAGPV